MKVKLLGVVAAAAVGFGASAEEKRELDAHEHGHSILNIAVEGDTVAMEFEAPGADIVGFEHPAESAEDKAAIEAAEETLAKPLALFTPPEAAGCSVAAASAHLVGDAHHEEHGHEEHGHEEHGHEEHAEHEEHGDEKHAEHDHGHDHAEEKHEEHAEHDHDAHDHDEEHAHEGEEAAHSEFHASYELTCSNVAGLTSLEFGAFAQFPNMEEVEVTLISDKGQKSFEVEREGDSAPSLDLSGSI